MAFIYGLAQTFKKVIKLLFPYKKDGEGSKRVQKRASLCYIWRGL